jgi:hypothetical protein
MRERQPAVRCSVWVSRAEDGESGTVYISMTSLFRDFHGQVHVLENIDSCRGYFLVPHVGTNKQKYRYN